MTMGRWGLHSEEWPSSAQPYLEGCYRTE